jgi:hypothetical protein
MMRRVLIASLVVHGALFALLMRTRVTAPVAIEAPAPEPIEVQWNEPSPAAVPMNEGPVAMATERRTTVTKAAPSPAATTEVVEAPADTAPYASNGTLFVWAPNIGVGAKGSNPFLLGGPGQGGTSEKGAPVDPLAVPENKKAEQAVKDGLRARDQSIGLGLEGPVVTALEGATHAGFAPEHGTATFLAVIDERGLVIDLRLVSSTASNSDAARGWEDVRKRAVKSLATAKIEMRGVKHAELKIEVESNVLLASGSDPKAPVKPVVNNGSHPTTIITEAPGGGNTMQTQGGADFDVTDLAGKKSRVVHAKLVMMTTR